MQAYTVRLYGNFPAGDSSYPLLPDHREDTRNGLLLIGDHRARLCTRHQRAILLIGAVSKDLAGCLQPGFPGSGQQPGAGKPQQDQRRIDSLDSRADGICHPFILSGHIVHRTMRLDMLQPKPLCFAERLQCTDLINDHCTQLIPGNLQPAPAKTNKVRKARMGTDCCLMHLAKLRGLLHDQRICRMESTGRIR